MRYLLFLIVIISTHLHADTIDHYMNIAGNIPQMEVKADPQAQAWARSARTVLMLTCESVVETLTLANESATQMGKPLFCAPLNPPLNATILNDIIQQTYREISSQQSDKNKMTVSQVALLGLSRRYPCQSAMQNTPTAQMLHTGTEQVLANALRR